MSEPEGELFVYWFQAVNRSQSFQGFTEGPQASPSNLTVFVQVLFSRLI